MLGLPDPVRACLFDLDGVLTRTAAVHEAAWRDTFDAFLQQWAGGVPPGTAIPPSTAESGAAPSGPALFSTDDYLRYVDGRPRADGVREFLRSRGIALPEGTPDDPPGFTTIAAIGNRKNEALLARLRADGVAVYDGSVAYLRAVKAAGLATAVVTASANGAAVLAATGLAALIDTRIDGVIAAERHLAGKPAPDTFLAAAAALGVAPAQAAVFEDALAGVAAGRAGHFGFVVGVDRAGQAGGLHRSGADVVVADLGELLEAA